jgi:hypothetical protein
MPDMQLVVKEWKALTGGAVYSKYGSLTFVWVADHPWDTSGIVTERV